MKKQRIIHVMTAMGIGLLMLIPWMMFNTGNVSAQLDNLADRAPEAVNPILATFEDGLPAGFVGFADSWDGTGSATTIAFATAANAIPVVPASMVNKTFVLTYSIASTGGWGGGPGYGGIFHDFPVAQDWSGYDVFSMWYYGSNTGVNYRIELKTQGVNVGGSNRFQYTFSDDFAGWKHFAVPFDAFIKRTDYNPGAGLGDVLVLEEMWGYSLLLEAPGAGTIQLDNIALYHHALLHDFEKGIPSGLVGFADSWDGTGSATTIAYNTASNVLPSIPISLTNHTFVLTYSIASSGGWGGGPGYGGVTYDTPSTRDWSDYDGLQFWYYGSDTGINHRIELKTQGGAVAGSNRFVYTFADDFAGWKLFTLPWDIFTKRTDYNPGSGLGDVLVLEEMWGYSLLLEAPGAGTLMLDNVALFGPPGDGSEEPPPPPPPPPAANLIHMVDDFEGDTLPYGEDGNSQEVGFVRWSHPSATVTLTLTQEITPAAPGSTQVLRSEMQIAAGQWAGFTHAFENETVDGWVSQDWSMYEGVSVWIYGRNTGGVLFFDISENRNPGSTVDDAERWSVDIPDNFNGWEQFVFSWNNFNRKEIGNGAPNDGLTLEEVWGYSVGGYGSVDMGTNVYYVDDVALLKRTTVIDDFEGDVLPYGEDNTGQEVGFVLWGHTLATVTLTLTQEITPAAPGSTQVLRSEMKIGPGQWAGFTHAFENETVDGWVSQDWSTYEGISVWIYGRSTGGLLFFDISENRNPGSIVDDAERWSVDIPDNFTGWKQFIFTWSDFNRKEIGNGAPNDGLTLEEVWGYSVGGYGSVDMGTNVYYVDDVLVFGNTEKLPDTHEVAFADTKASAVEGNPINIKVTLNMTSSEVVSVSYTTAESYATPGMDYIPVSGTLVFAPGETEKFIVIPTLEDSKHEGTEQIMVLLSNAEGAKLGFRSRLMAEIKDDDPFNPALIADFEGFHAFETTGDLSLSTQWLTAGTSMARPGQDPFEGVLVVTDGPAGGTSAGEMEQVFVEPQDWSAHTGMSFWYFGGNTSETIHVNLLDNQITTTADVSPLDWVMVWSDEFDDASGTAPNANYWRHEIGDGTMNGIPGWGNGESQFYTDDPANASTNGAGDLVIRMQEAPEGLVCWYGPCEYTSARLISANRVEFEYGKVEARLKVPSGPSGLWPAFWMLGTNIGEVGWPQSGEIDIMEYVSRIPYEAFGTIHGPGYSGGASYGNTWTFTEPVSATYHTFSVVWQPDYIEWYVDGNLYHTAEPGDVAPNQWVFNHPFYIILNLAIGGNFGGQISENMTMPQDYLVDYVRVYQAKNTSERFASSFTDDFTGWKRVFLPFEDFSRSSTQPDGAPDDGLGLTEVWGYGFEYPNGVLETVYMDKIELYGQLPVMLDDFEDGLSGYIPFGDFEWNVGSTTKITLTITEAPEDIPRSTDVTQNNVLQVDYTVGAGGYAGFSRAFTKSQNWSMFNVFSFWFYGENSGMQIQVDIFDNTGGTGEPDAERFAYWFTDNFTGWKKINIPFSAFIRNPYYNPPLAPNDGLGLTEMWGYAFTLPGGHTGQFYVDEFMVENQFVLFLPLIVR